MTIEQLITMLESIKVICENVQLDKPQFIFILGLMSTTLRKQTPQTPCDVEYMGGIVTKARCPTCGERFPDIGGVAECYNEVEMSAYCKYCGQAIDWSEEGF